MSATIVLNPKREKSLLRRHPWIFSKAISKIDGEPQLGETVDVVSASGQWLARAAYSPNSQIRARAWSFERKQKIDSKFFEARIKSAQSLRGLLARFSEGDSYRLVAGENDQLPGITIDRYADVLVLQLLSAGAEFHRQTIIDALIKLYPQCCIYERSDVDVRKKEGLEPRVGVIHGQLPAQPMIIQENGLQLLVNIESGHKTGYYLDQRNNRKLIGSLSKGKNVLNCFSYSGGFGTYALAGGASKVTNVDVSAPALELAAKNAEINQLDTQRLVNLNADVFAQLRVYKEQKVSFDLIVLDPPKFVDSKASLAKASRGYKDINMHAMALLPKGGLLASYSCSGLMPRDLFQKIMADAALDAGRQIRFIKSLEQAEDHPVGGAYPEGYYLKGFLCVVD
ncbi:23S rRNA (cytosine(1962)-C(5))-methyltransferase RlmI [Alginatibacterium sediminis]|uniref:23S rRNA (Cytosine(1962)-C(5))-methyltransferase RlmI n=1 Tax=Alginatibacterium sediminis TaxID=2164068 RepID=A0A420ECT3_9ALTE|nr:class I SAM-dependent methyltransferase [Alginatibacterium sediminis]RKF18475.1 23S rRNA (cytosine(1962)-C(5))-methyltransferase RlmI [Alginatibacterium sediminis]